MEVFHLRMGYPSISQYIPIKRLRRCWTIMAIAWIFASEWQTNAQSSEKPTCCDWTSPARDGCAMCWKCFPLCHENASMCEWKHPDPTDSPPGCGLVLLKWLLCPLQPGLSGIYPSEKPPPWSLLVNDILMIYLHDPPSFVPGCPWLSGLDRSHLGTEPASRSAASDFSAMACHRIFQLKMQQSRSELFVHYGYVCLKCALCVVYIHLYIYIYICVCICVFLMCLYMCTST